jgi:hypothetical protein
MSQRDIDIERAWQKYRSLDQGYSQELASCRRNKRPFTSKALRNLKADCEKARLEYEKLKGGMMHDPQNPETSAALTRRKVIRAFLGKEGPDSHTRIP